MLLIVLAGAAVAFFIWKRKGSATPSTTGFGGGANTAVDPSVGGDAGGGDTPTRAARPGFGGGTSTATGGAVPTTRTSTTSRTPAPVYAPVTRGTPTGGTVPTGATQPLYIPPSKNTVTSSGALLSARLVKTDSRSLL